VPSHQDHLLAAAALLRDAGLESQTEIKPGGVAVHWRGLDPVKAEKVAKEVPRLWKPLLDRAPLRVLDLTLVLEFVSPVQAKVTPFASFLKEAGRALRRLPG